MCTKLEPASSKINGIRKTNVLQTFSPHALYHLCSSVLDAEQRALQDGRIGDDTVNVDLSSQCGTMKINKERVEVGFSSSFSFKGWFMGT